MYANVCMSCVVYISAHKVTLSFVCKGCIWLNSPNDASSGDLNNVGRYLEHVGGFVNLFQISNVPCFHEYEGCWPTLQDRTAVSRLVILRCWTSWVYIAKYHYIHLFIYVTIFIIVKMNKIYLSSAFQLKKHKSRGWVPVSSVTVYY